MVVAGTVTVKVELDGSDVPSDLARAVNSQLKPALAKAENDVSQSTRKIKKSVESIGPSLGGVGTTVGKTVRPALRDVERDVDRAMLGVRNKIAGIGGAFAGIGRSLGGPASGIAVAAGNVTKGLAGIGTAGSVAATGVLAVGAAAAASVAAVAAIGAVAGVVGKQFYDLGMEADALNDKLAIKTGGSAAEIGKLTDSIQKLGTTSVPMSFDAIGDVAVDVTRNLKLAGPALEEVTSRIANLGRMTGEAVNVKAFGDATKKFKITDQVAAINELNKVSQQTGLSFNTLTAALDNGGAALGAAGFGFGESAALLGQLNSAGIDAGEIMPGITKLLREAPKYGKSGETALRDAANDIKALSDAGRDIEAQGLATKLFGRGSLPLFKAIKEGTVDLNNLKIDGPIEDVNALSDRTNDWNERWEVLKNNIKKAMEPLATAVFDKVGEQLTKLADWITANQDSIVLFFVDLGTVFIDLGSAALRGIGEVVRAVGYLMAPIGDVLGGLATLDAAIADALGNDEDAAASRKQAEGFFAWGETLTKVGNAAIDASKGSDAAKEGIERIGAAVRDATGETDAFGNEIAELPVDGVDVPISVSGIPEADAAMDDLFTKYRTLAVGVEIGDAAAAGVLGGAMLGNGIGGNGPIVGTGIPYGLPAGTSTGGYGGPGQDKFPQWVRDLGAQFGVSPSTYSGHQESGGLNQGIDWVGTTDAMDRFAKALAASKPGGLEQVIWQNPETGEMTGLTPDGRVVKRGGEYYRDDWAKHRDHVHTAFTGSVAMGVPRGGSPNDPQAGANLDNIPVTAPANMPPAVDPGAAPVPPAPAITVAPIEVPVIPLFTTPGDDPELNRLQAQADAANNAQRARDASKARTAAAQAVADARAKADADQAALTAVLADNWAKPEERTAADAALLESTKALTDAQTAEAELISKQQTDSINDQIAARRQQIETTKKEPFDYTKLPLGDSRRIAAQAFMGAGGTAEEFDALMGGNAGPAAQQAVGQAAQAAAAPIGQAAGDAAAAAINTNLLPVGTPTAPDTETNRLLAEQNPAVVAKLAGIDVPDYTRQGGDPGDVTRAGGFDASGRIMGDTAAMIDRTLTSMEAANKARQDQLLSILQAIATKVGVEVLSPIVTAATTGALTGIAADIGTAMGETAGPIIGDDTAAAVDEKVQAQESGTGALPGMAGGGGIYGGTPGKDSVPAMLMPGEYVLTTGDVARMGGFAGVERVLGSLQANGGMRYYASGGGVGRASTGNPNGGQNVNSTVGADFFGLSQIPVLALAINALTQVLLKVIDVEITQRDALIEVGKEFRDFRGDFQAFDAAGRIKNNNAGLTDRTSSSQKQAADERLRILKMVIDGLVKYIIEKILVPLGKAIGSAVVSAIAGAAGGALSGAGSAIAGGVVSAAISAAGQVAIDIAAEIFTIAAETLITIGLDVIGEFLQTLFPQLTTSLLGGAVLEQIAGPVSAVMTNAIGIVTSLTTNLLGNLGGVFANFIPTFQGFLAGFVPLTASLAAIVGVLSSVAAVLQQILTALLGLGAGIGSSIVSAVTSALSGFMPLLSNLNLTTNSLGSVAQLLAGLVPNLGGVVASIAPAGAALNTAFGGITALVGGLSAVVAPTATVNPIAAAATTTANNVSQLVTALSSGTLQPSRTVNAPITVISATTTTATNIANRLLALTG